MEKNDTIISKMTNLQKLLAIFALILTTLGSIFVGGRALLSEIKETIKEVSDENVEETRREIEDLGFLTTEAFEQKTDSILYELEINRTVNDTLHKRSFMNQRDLGRKIESVKYSDADVKQRIEEIRKRLNELQGIAELTREEQAAQAYTDSLIGVNTLLQQKEIDRQRRRSDELEFDKLTREIRELSKGVVIDKGRRKTIRVKPNGGKQGKVTRSKNY